MAESPAAPSPSAETITDALPAAIPAVPVAEAAETPAALPLVPAAPEVPKPPAAEEAATVAASAANKPTDFERFKPPSADDIYSSERTTPEKATSFDGDESDIDASVRERIEQDSKRVGKIAENLVGVQGDINRVEKEVLGKVFDMSSMKTFLNAHEAAIKDHEKLDIEEEKPYE